MYSIINRIQTNTIISDSSPTWVKMINDELNLSVSRLNTQRIESGSNKPASMATRLGLLKHCALDMLENVST